jgi:hypothetical protein
MPNLVSSQKIVASRKAGHDHQEEPDPPKGGERREWEFRSALMVGICVTRRLQPYCTPCSRFTH